MNTACVYKIFCKDNSITKIYIGSTKNIKQRIWGHRSNYFNNSNSDDRRHHQPVYNFIRDNGGIDNWEFEVLENCCDDKRKQKEQEWIVKLNPELNSTSAFKSEDEIKAYKHEHYEANKEQYLERAKKCAEANKEHRQETNKAWRETNKEVIAEKKKAYYEANKEAIKAKVKVRTDANKDAINARRRELAKEKRDELVKLKQQLLDKQE